MAWIDPSAAHLSHHTHDDGTGKWPVDQHKLTRLSRSYHRHVAY